MSNENTVRNNIVAAIAAFAVSSACILGTVGPVNASQGSDHVQLAQVEGGTSNVWLG